MGAEQAATVLSEVRRAKQLKQGDIWTAAQEMQIRQPIIEQYEAQARPLYSSARLWDDGVIDPLDTRKVLGLSLNVALNAPIPPTQFGIFRM